MNAVALGSIATERYQAFLTAQEPAAKCQFGMHLRQL